MPEILQGLAKDRTQSTHCRDGSLMNAVVTMASDAVHDSFRAFAESFYEFNGGMQLYVIPYSNDFDKIRRLQEAYNFHIVQFDFSEIDRLRRELFPTLPYSGRLRKLAAFGLGLRYFLYIDADTVVLQSFRVAFDDFVKSGVDISFCAHSWDWVYRIDFKSDLRFKNTNAFSTGCLFVRLDRTRLEDILTVIERNRALYTSVRNEFVVDQPLLNFYADVTGLDVRRIDQVSPSFVGNNYFEDHVIVEENGRVRTRSGQEVLFIHWAGEKKNASEEIRLWYLRERYLRRSLLRFGG